MTRHILKWKQRQLQELKKLANQYPVLAVADLTGFPASLFQKLRKKLRGKAEIRVSKIRVIRKAFEESNIDSEKLNKYVNNSIAIIFTSMNPFELYAFLKKNKGNIAAKEGAIAQADIIVPAGDTGMPPGPALSDLKAAGLKVVVQGSTIHIANDKVVTKKGEEVNAAVAGTLSKLDIKPIKVGLNVIACYENKEIYESNILNIEIDEVRANFMKAYTQAFNLAFNAGYFVKETIELLVQKAFRETKTVALEANIITPSTAPDILAKASRQAHALKAALPKAPTEEKKEEQAKEGEAAEEKKESEEKKEEALVKEKEESKEEKKKKAGQNGKAEKKEKKAAGKKKPKEEK